MFVYTFVRFLAQDKGSFLIQIKSPDLQTRPLIFGGARGRVCISCRGWSLHSHYEPILIHKAARNHRLSRRVGRSNSNTHSVFHVLAVCSFVILLFTINRQGRSARAVAAAPARAPLWRRRASCCGGAVALRAKSIKCCKTKLTIKNTRSHNNVKISALSN